MSKSVKPKFNNIPTEIQCKIYESISLSALTGLLQTNKQTRDIVKKCVKTVIIDEAHNLSILRLLPNLTKIVVESNNPEVFGHTFEEYLNKFVEERMLNNTKMLKTLLLMFALSDNLATAQEFWKYGLQPSDITAQSLSSLAQREHALPTGRHVSPFQRDPIRQLFLWLLKQVTSESVKNEAVKLVTQHNYPMWYLKQLLKAGAQCRYIDTDR